MGKGARNRRIRREAVALVEENDDLKPFGPRGVARALRKGRLPLGTTVRRTVRKRSRLRRRG